MTDDQLAALYVNHFDQDGSLVASTMFSNRRTVADLVRVMEARGDTGIRARMKALLQTTKLPTWREVAGDWLKLQSGAVLTPCYEPPQDAPEGSIAVADGVHWNPLGVGWCVVRKRADGWGELLD